MTMTLPPNIAPEMETTDPRLRHLPRGQRDAPLHVVRQVHLAFPDTQRLPPPRPWEGLWVSVCVRKPQDVPNSFAQADFDVKRFRYCFLTLGAQDQDPKYEGFP